jgi:hypothetical protein
MNNKLRFPASKYLVNDDGEKAGNINDPIYAKLSVEYTQQVRGDFGRLLALP